MTKILVIEDETVIRENIAEILGYEGYEVVSAENGMLGVQRARNLMPDLIISDIMMPQLDGYGVLMELRSQPDTAAIPFIFLTAKTDRDSMRLGMNAGADDFLIKPCGRDEIVAAVSARMAKREVVEQIYEKSLEELRGSLMKMLPHELRTPLTSIMGYAELLKMEYTDLSKAELDERLDLILQAGRRLFRVVENYLLYAQIEIFRRDAKTMDVIALQEMDNPGVIIRDVGFQKAFQRERMEDVVIEAEDVTVRIDADSLRKITEELVDNALRFSAAGTKVEVTGAVTAGVYALRVSDAGRGMTNDQINRVGAYMQFERKLYEQQGLGLGLILARNLAELHRGRLTIQSVLNEGTTVLVELLV